jgi:hypothetical protein
MTLIPFVAAAIRAAFSKAHTALSARAGGYRSAGQPVSIDFFESAVM